MLGSLKVSAAMKLPTITQNNTTMSNTDTTLAAAATASITGHAAITALVTSAGKFAAQAGSFKAQIVRSVTTLRKEGYSDTVIREAIREVLKDSDVSRQFVNRVLTLEADKGGCGMPKERNHAEKATGHKDAPKESGESPKKFDLKSPEECFAALMVAFEGNADKIIGFAERLNELAFEAQLKPAKAVDADVVTK